MFYNGMMVHFGTTPEDYAAKVAHFKEHAETQARQAKLKKKIAKENAK